MKKILIVNKSFETGGIQSALINMANELSNYYEVDLLIFYPDGELRERINKKVNVLAPSWRLASLGAPLQKVISAGSLTHILFKLFAMLWSRICDNRLPIAIAIKHQEKLVGYDLAIAYHQEQRKHSTLSGFTRVVDQRVIANNKVAWLHFDSNTIDLDSKFNNPFYQRMDRIICVSESLKDNFLKNHPQLYEKVDYCYNFMPYDVIHEKSMLEQNVNFPEGGFICFSACRLAEEKGIVRAINALSSVFKQYRDVFWFIAGDGPERKNIEMAIQKNGLNDQIILIGNQSNPYVYMKNSDLVLNVSYHEAAPMVFFESKALGTPIFASRTSSAEELLNDNVDSFICENSAEGIRDAFEWLMANRDLIDAAKEHLKHYHADNEQSLMKIRELIGDI